MFFLIDKSRKIIFGWSAKCGCTHIKNIFNYLTNIDISTINSKKVHDICSHSKLPINFSEYLIILIIRNPYKRIVSGFLDKYNYHNYFYKKYWPKNLEMTFTNFVNQLVDNNGLNKTVEKHHFTPQLSEEWNSLINPDKIYDIENIDYNYIEILYDIKIPKEIINYRGNYNKTIKECEFKHVYDIPIHIYTDSKPSLKQFYNDELFDKVTNFYKKDLDYFKSYGFNYDLE